MNNVKNDIEFTLLENGLDFILSSAQYIDMDNYNKYNVKYSILHISSGMELIFKYKLMLTDWKQVFQKVNEADYDKFIKGDFTSVNSQECQKRLRKVCSIDFSDDEKKLLKNLREKRNKLEHFVILDSYESLMSYLMKVLSIIVEFITNNFENDTFTDSESNILEKIRFKIGEIEVFVNHRWNVIRGEIDNYLKYGSVLKCPSCFQDSLITDDGTKCLFCGYTDESNKVATKYIERILEISEYATVKDGGIYPKYSCPECGDYSFINDEILEIWKCTNCGIEYNDDEVEMCSYCGNPYGIFNGDDIEMCSDCIYDIIEND